MITRTFLSDEQKLLRSPLRGAEPAGPAYRRTDRVSLPGPKCSPPKRARTGASGLGKCKADGPREQSQTS